MSTLDLKRIEEDKNGAYIIIKDDYCHKLVDLNSKDELDLMTCNRLVYGSVMEALKETDLYIGEVKIKDLALITNLMCEEKTVEEIRKEIELAHMFENKDIELEKVIGITEEEVDDRLDEIIYGGINNPSIATFYELQMLKYRSVEKLYNRAFPNTRDKIISLYIDMAENKSPYHIRTSSSVINVESLKRKMQEDNKQKQMIKTKMPK